MHDVGFVVCYTQNHQPKLKDHTLKNSKRIKKKLSNLPLYKIYSSFSSRDSELFRLDVNHRFLKQIQLTFLKAFNEETF